VVRSRLRRNLPEHRSDFVLGLDVAVHVSAKNKMFAAFITKVFGERHSAEAIKERRTGFSFICPNNMQVLFRDHGL